MADREKLFDLMMRDPCPSPVICNPNCKYYKSHHCHAERYADHLIANGVTVKKWIPANEPPKDNTENQWVIYKVGGSYFYTTGYYDGKNWRSAITDNRIQIAGWMPLPEPPKGE